MSLTKKPLIQHEGNITIVMFEEEFEHIGEDVMPAVATAIEDAGNSLVPKVLLDLGHVRFFGSSFIEALYRLWKQMESRKGKFVIAGLHPYCREVLQVTKLDKLWTITDDREAGLAILREFALPA